MTIIDTTLYADGALRLSRHGAGRGGNVLMHVKSHRQIELSDEALPKAVYQITHMEGRVSGDILFSAIERIYSPH